MKTKMETRKSVIFLFIITLLVSGMLLTNCPEETEVKLPSTTADQVKITQDPISKSFILADWNSASADLKTLTVALSETGSNISYQWYTRTDPKSEGTIINGATGTSYLPVISSSGNYYYYVIVTIKTTEETKELVSGTAYIKITDAYDPAPTEYKIGDARLNYVRGVGGTGSFMFRAGIGDASPDADIQYVELLMKELGANILRIMVQDDYENYITNSVQSTNPTPATAAGVYFYHDAKKNFFPVIRKVNELGGYVFANPWTAPASMKTNNDLIGQGGNLKSGGPNYTDYADHLRNFLKWLNQNNAPIFAIGILNEPDYGNTAGYEGMGMTGSATRDWFKTVGNFTTQYVDNRSGAGVTTSILKDDIIEGYGGGGKTHHVLAMSGDSMGDIKSYMDAQLNDNDSNKYIELMGRHYYASTARYTKVVGNPPHESNPTAWADRPQLGYNGPHEAASLAMSPQMYAPGSTAGNIKREIWQTEHDFNWGSSTSPPANNGQTYWNAAFAPLNDIDWALRVCGESVYCWWYSSSHSGFVTSYQNAGWAPYTITPRGRAFAHYARYVNETWFLPITKTNGNIDFNTSTTYNAGAKDPKISAFEDVNGKFISVVMYTPTEAGTLSADIGGGGRVISDDPTNGSTDVGRIAIFLPDGFTASGATAIRSYGHANATGESWDNVPTGTPRYWIDEPVFLSKNSEGKSFVEVTLPGGNIISIMIKGTWSGRSIASPERVRPYTVK